MAKLNTNQGFNAYAILGFKTTGDSTVEEIDEHADIGEVLKKGRK